MGFGITIFYFLLFLALIKKSKLFELDSIPFFWIVLAFSIRVITGILYGYFDAKIIHGGDSLNYFADANWIFGAARTEPLSYLKIITGIGDDDPNIINKYYAYLITWNSKEFDYFPNEGRNIVRLHAIIRLISLGHYNVHVIISSFLSMIGLTLLFKTFTQVIRLSGKFLFIILFFFPSILLWSSTLLKEPLLFLGLGIFTSGIFRITLDNSKFDAYIQVVLGAVILLLLRFNILLSLLPGLLIYLWYSRTKRGLLKKTILIYLAFIVLAVNFHHIVPGYNVSHILYGKLMNFVKNEQAQNPDHQVEFTPLEPTFIDLLLHSPKAFVSTLMAPLKNIFSNKFRMAYFIETILLLILIVQTIYHARKNSNKPIHAFIVFCISFVIIQYILIGLTVPFEGTVVRLRSLPLPFLLLFILSFADHTKFRLPFIKA
jgi:hypothetical protein